MKPNIGCWLIELQGKTSTLVIEPYTTANTNQYLHLYWYNQLTYQLHPFGGTNWNSDISNYFNHYTSQYTSYRYYTDYAMATKEVDFFGGRKREKSLSQINTNLSLTSSHFSEHQNLWKYIMSSQSRRENSLNHFHLPSCIFVKIRGGHSDHFDPHI